MVALERWPRDGVPRNPAAWIIDHRPQPGHRPAAARAPARARSSARAGRAGTRRGRRGRRGRERHPRRPAAADLHLLPPGAGARGAGGADAAHRSAACPRPRSRARSWWPSRRWRSAWSAPSARSATPASPTRCRADRELPERLERGAGRALPDLQRGLRGHRAATRSSAASCATRRSGSRACSRDADAATSPRSLGLLALMLLHHSRRDARVGRRRRARAARGPGPLPLGPRRDRRGRGAASSGRARGRPARTGAGRDRRRARVAPTSTDWPRIAALYELLAASRRRPVVELNRAVAVAMADGPGSAGSPLVDELERAATSTATTCSTPPGPTCCAAWAGATRPRPPTARALELAGEPGRAALPRAAAGRAG